MRITRRAASPAALVVAAAASIATQREKNTFTVVEGEIVVSPVLYDLGHVPMGSSAEATFEVRWIAGSPVTLYDAVVSEVMGGSFEGPPPSEFPVVVDDGVPLAFDVRFEPLAEGYHLAQLEIETDSRGCRIWTLVRAHAGVPSAEVAPTTLDFGDVGEDGGTLHLELVNTGRMPVEVRSHEISDPAFSWGGVDVVPVGEAFVVPIHVVPPDAAPLVGTLTLDLGEGIAPVVVQLRANDCEDGSPVAYDPDGDGLTSCGTSVPEGADADGDGFSSEDGDCDDADPDRLACGDPVADDLDGDHFTVGDGDCDDASGWAAPDMLELCDGIDNDCDDAVDEGCEGRQETCDVEEEPGCGCATGPAGAAQAVVALAGLIVRLRRAPKVQTRYAAAQ